MITRYADWILRWRWPVVVLTPLIVFALAAGGQFLQFDNDYRVFFSKENPQLVAFESMQDIYAKNDNVLIMLEPDSGKAFDKNTLAAVIDLTERAWQIPYSRRVDSVSNFQYTQAEEDDLIVDDLVPYIDEASEDELQRWQAIAVKEPMLVYRLVSPDASVTAINVTVQLPGIDLTSEGPEVVSFVRAILEEYRARYPDIKFHDTGVVMMNNAFPEATMIDMQTLIPLAFAVIIVGLMIFLRGVLPTIVTVLVILMSIMMAMGITGWLGIKLTPPSASAPTLIMTLAVADCVHMLVSFGHNLREGMNRRAAMVESLRINFHPIFLTSLTTAVGFLSMNFSDVPPFHDLGNITAIGVMLAFVLSVTFLPALCVILPIKARGVERGNVLMDRLAGFVVDRRRPLLWIMGLFMVGLIAAVPKNELNDVFVEYFDTSVPFRVKTDYIQDRLTGLYFIDYSLDSEDTNGVADPKYLGIVDSFVAWLREQPEVMHVNTFTDTMKRLNKNMHGDDDTYYRLPDNRELAAQYLLLYEMSLPYGLDLNNQLNVSKSATRISATLETMSTADTLKFEKRAQQWLDEHGDGILNYAASPTLMFSHIGMRNIQAMLLGTTIALVVISLILIVALRSFKFGLISLIPNLVPAGMAFGLWALMVGQVGLAVSVVAAMALGIVVDDTIHFLSKYLRARRELDLDAEQAVRYAFSTVGVALTVTTIVLVAGFMVLAQSNFELNASMGLLTAITIVIALAVDFLFLPPLLMIIEEKRNAHDTRVTLQEQEA
ncbi:MAG: MMPL family transporter [Gammaproteobacteria bacterium]|nr:MMPL family transporter [Gammaproteobacteria bacterium]